MAKPEPYDHDHENEVQLFAKANFRNRSVRFGIKTDDRRRHVYVIGKSGMGKTTLLENMILSDIHAGHGCCYIDPHGDTAQKILDYIPSHRINDVVYFNPSDTAFPIGFNILESVDPDKKHLVAAGLMAVFKKIWPDVWSARMEYILVNTILALLDVPGATLLGINRLYVDEEYRKRVVSLIQDPIVKTFWVKEFAGFSEKYRTEAVAPVQNKVGQFMSASIIRNIVAQVKSTIDMRDIMDNRKILIVNLSKGLIGEENMHLLGGMLITRLQLAAMERVDMPEKDRQDFYLYVDEFQNFANESFATILSEARKYRLGLVMAHQYIEQLDETVASAIFGNVGTMITFRVGGPDAEVLEKEFAPHFTPEDLIGLTKYDVYLRLLIDGVASQPFSATTLPPIAEQTNSTDKVVRVSRERYARSRKSIEDNVIKWSGFGTGDMKTEEELEEEEARADSSNVSSHAEPNVSTAPTTPPAPIAPPKSALLVESSESGESTPFSMGGEDDDERIKELQASSPYVGETAKSSDGGGFGQKKKKEVKHEVPCSVCGEMQKLTFDPDWSKPWFCKNHLEVRNTPMARKLPSIAKMTGRDDSDAKGASRGDVARPTMDRPAMPPRVQDRPARPDISRLKPVEIVSENAGSPLSLSQLKPQPKKSEPAKSNKPRIVVSSGEDNAAEELLSVVVPIREKPAEPAAAEVKSVAPLTSPVVSREISPPPPKPVLNSGNAESQQDNRRSDRAGRNDNRGVRKPRVVTDDSAESVMPNPQTPRPYENRSPSPRIQEKNPAKPVLTGNQPEVKTQSASSPVSEKPKQAESAPVQPVNAAPKLEVKSNLAPAPEKTPVPAADTSSSVTSQSENGSRSNSAPAKASVHTPVQKPAPAHTPTPMPAPTPKSAPEAASPSPEILQSQSDVSPSSSVGEKMAEQIMGRSNVAAYKKTSAVDGGTPPLTSPIVDRGIEAAEAPKLVTPPETKPDTTAMGDTRTKKGPPDDSTPSVGGYDDTVTPGQSWKPGQVVKF